jgi:hypothetical protein
MTKEGEQSDAVTQRKKSRRALSPKAVAAL